MTNASRAAASVAAALVLVACDSGRAPAPSPSPTSTARPATIRFEVPEPGDAFGVGVTLRTRLKAYGADPGAPRVDGRTITIEVRHEVVRGHLVAMAGRGGLRFREVIQEFPPAECAEPATRGPFLARAGSAPDSSRIVTCGEDGVLKYELGPAEPGVEVLTAEAVTSPGPATPPTWLVSMRLRPELWEAVTGRLVGKQLAIVIDGTVWSAPMIAMPITDGNAEISGKLDEGKARVLAALAASPRIDGPVTVLP